MILQSLETTSQAHLYLDRSAQDKNISESATFRGPHSACPATHPISQAFRNPPQGPETSPLWHPPAHFWPMQRVRKSRFCPRHVPQLYLLLSRWELAHQQFGTSPGFSLLPSTFICLHLSLSCLGTLPKAFLLLEPPWSRTFEGEKVNLICKDDHSRAQGYVSWHYNGIFWQSRSGTIQIDKSGYYSCKTPTSSFSDPVRVEFLSGEERKG